MIRTNKILSIAAASALMFFAAPSSLWAESAAPGADASGFLGNVNCPDPYVVGAGNPCFDAKAPGTKYAGTLAVVYDKTDVTPTPTCATGQIVNNVYVNLTLAQSNAKQGNVSGIFTTDYVNGVHPTTAGFCFLDNEKEQAQMVIELIRSKVMTHFYGCTPPDAGCPNFKVKSLTNDQYSVGTVLSDTSTRGFSVNITIAVQ